MHCKLNTIPTKKLMYKVQEPATASTECLDVNAKV